MLELSRKYKINHFIFASSSSVYGTKARSPFREDEDNLKPISVYAATKIAGELLCKNYSETYNINITCLRFFTAYGPRQRPEMAIHKFTRRLYNNEPIEIFGKGKLERDFTYISDIIDGIMKSLNKVFKFEIFNLGRGKKVNLNYIISLIQDYTNIKGKIVYKPTPPGDVPLTFADISKAKNILGYNPNVDLEEGMKKFIQWYNKKLLN